MASEFLYSRLFVGSDNHMLSVGDVITVSGYEGIRFVVMPNKLNRKQDKQWDAAIKKAEKLQLTSVAI